MEDIKKIYFDLDGVLADFNRGLSELCGITPVDQSVSTEQDDNATFDAIRKADHFYRNLELVTDAKYLFDMVYDLYGDKCEILTGVPSPRRNIPDAAEDKIAWVKEKLSDKVVIHTVRRAEKKDYCRGPGYVLIDDYQKNIDEWAAVGGTGILFQDADRAMEELVSLMEKIAEEDDKMEKEKQVRRIRPMSSIDFEEIAAGWNGEFNKDISNPTDQWKLIAYPVMPGEQTTQAALIFQQEVNINEPECSSLFKYRVLLYDMTVSPVLMQSSEFQFKDWRVYTAWFLKGHIYAAMVDDELNFEVITICGDGNERILSLGRYVTDISATSNGDILAGYDCCADDDDDREPVIMYLRRGENRTLKSDDAMTCEAVCIDSKDNIWAYIKPYNYICHMEGDKYETFPITLTGFSGIGVSDDGRMLLASIGYKYGGTRLYVFKRNEDDVFCDQTEIVLDTEDDQNEEKLISAAFAGNKAVFRKGRKLYMYNINELSLVMQDCESNVEHNG